ncbi:MBL fold metallo-hydrolase [Streptomyces sp. NPDC021080]|uniref:MBL fold metallo-hydrolase n=1 Tax=Streptomyces sp. NPDC021080 TaxID=3365110 RepID=UPI003789222A
MTVYVLETDAGPYLIDGGWDTEEAWQVLTSGLARIGTRVEDVQGILVSHSHMDHYGMAPRIREASGAWVSLHRLDAAELPHFRLDPAERLAALLRRAAAPDAAVADALSDLGRRNGHDALPPDVFLEDGQRPEVPGWDLTALWTPGHTPGHLCFWDERYRLLIAGDHALPRTAVGVHEPAGPQDDPLGRYLDSLGRLERLGPEEVLPAHEHRFSDLPGRVRELRDHHARHLADTVVALRSGPLTTWEMAGRLRSRGTLDGLRGFPLYFAVVRAMALLAHLRQQGLAEQEPGGAPFWTLTDRARMLHQGTKDDGSQS